jgi:CBS domain containing-hemolysin-like protein
MTLLLVYASVALGVSFFCSLAEAALLSMTPFFVQNLVREGHRSAKLLVRLESKMDQALAAILSLNTIAHTVGAVGVGAEAAQIFGSAFVGIASAVLTLLILVFSEIIPKTVGAAWWRTLAPVLAPAVWLLVRLLWPLVWLSERITRLVARGRPVARFKREELTAMAEVGAEEGELLPEELRVVTNLVRFRSIRAADIMTPRIVMFTLDETMTVAEATAAHPEIPFSRIPLYGRNPDDIDSVLLKADLYLAGARDRHDVALSELARPVAAVAETMPITELLEVLVGEGGHMAVLVDEYGGVAGIATLEDIIETLLGFEIVDELDTTTDMQQLARDLWRERAAKLGVEPTGSPDEGEEREK